MGYYTAIIDAIYELCSGATHVPVDANCNTYSYFHAITSERM